MGSGSRLGHPLVDGTEFVSIGGMTLPEPAFLPGWRAWIDLRTRHPGDSRPPDGGRWRYVVAEATDDLRAMLLGVGFHDVTTVRSYHWSPPEPAGAGASGGAGLLLDPQGDEIWGRFASQWEFSAATQAHPRLVEPPESVAWHLAAIEEDEAGIAALESIVQRGLRPTVRPASACMPFIRSFRDTTSTRDGPAGRGNRLRRAAPSRTAATTAFTTADLRLGTFGDPWGQSLCVFGGDLLAEVEADLTALLGTVLRRGGRPVGNVWSFGPDGHSISGP